MGLEVGTEGLSVLHRLRVVVFLYMSSICMEEIVARPVFYLLQGKCSQEQFVHGALYLHVIAVKELSQAVGHHHGYVSF